MCAGNFAVNLERYLSATAANNPSTAKDKTAKLQFEKSHVSNLPGLRLKQI
jgi:hypothetical protein